MTDIIKKEQKKVGIITYYNFYNYGSSLQAYALSEKIKDMGFCSVLIDYGNMSYKWNKKIKLKVIKDRVLCLLCNHTLISRFMWSKKIGRNAVVCRSEKIKEIFDEFTRDNFNLSEDDFTKRENDYAAFICGSDQVWQLSSPGLHPTFFLRFCEKNKRFSYAASFGTFTVPKYNRKKLETYLNDFKAVSVREDVAVDIVKRYSNQKEVKQVLDPVLLMSTQWWHSKRREYVLEDEYIVCYFLGNPDRYLNTIVSIKNHFYAKVIWIATGFEKPLLDEEVVEVSPFEFLDLIANSKYVCTDSLHGLEVSITFKKNFTIFARKYLSEEEQQSRIDSLVRLLRIYDRIWNEHYCLEDVLKKIDYEYIGNKLNDMRQISNNYLKDILGDDI